jgi:hypothetical protein
MSDESTMSNFEKAQLRAQKEGKSIIQIAVEEISKENSSNSLTFSSSQNSTITLQNLMFIRKAMDEIEIKDRSDAFQCYYDELVHTIVELKRNNNL